MYKHSYGMGIATVGFQVEATSMKPYIPISDLCKRRRGTDRTGADVGGPEVLDNF